MTTNWTNIAKPGAASWTDVPKPQGDTTVNIFAGNPIGLLLALTYAANSSYSNSPWTDVPKASGTTWTDVPKAI